jgi:hypothetical protein
MKNWFVKWMLRKIREEQMTGVPETLTGSSEPDAEPPKMRFAIRQALNGKFIEVSTYRPQHRGYDWVHEYYIVPDGKKVSEALTMLMLLKGADE